jgi:hypothetical protein
MGTRSVSRSVAAVIGGYAAIGVLIVLTDQLFSVLIPDMKSMPQPPPYYFAISLVTDFIYSIVGGWVCVRIAKERQMRHAAGLIVFGEAIGIASQIALWTTVPHWYGMSLLILYPPGVWLGAKLGLAPDRGITPAA